VPGGCGGQLAKQSPAFTGTEFFRQRSMSLQNLPDRIQDVWTDCQERGVPSGVAPRLS